LAQQQHQPRCDKSDVCGRQDYLRTFATSRKTQFIHEMGRFLQMFDDVEHKDLIELRDVHRELLPIKIPSDKIDLLRPLGGVGHIPVHPGDAATSPDQFRTDVTIAATNIDNMPASTRCGDASSVRSIESKLKIIGLLRQLADRI